MSVKVEDGELQRVQTLPGEQGTPTLGLYDKSGKVRVRFGLAAEGAPIVRLLDRDGKLRALIGLATDDTPFVQLLDPNEQPTRTLQ